MSVCMTESFCDNSVRRGTESLSGLWQSRLRTCRSGSMEATKHNKSETPRRITSLMNSTKLTPSSAASSAAGLTPSAGRGRATSLQRRSPSRVSASRSKSTRVTPTKERDDSVEVHRQCDPIAKVLFNKEYLLQSLEPHEPQPALTVVFDLDETLVSNRNANLQWAILRPYCLHVLNALRHKKNLEIVLWTASTKETAASVVEQLHESGVIFDDLIFRNKLWFTEPVHTKDLRLLGRDLDRVVIVDNSANCCKLHRGNSILIDDFHGFRHEEDAALVNVYYMIESLLKNSTEGKTVSEGLEKLVSEGHLCRTVNLQLPDAWRCLPLSEIAPLKLPPCGEFVRCNTTPPSRSIMKYWSY